jgi:DNA polymerase-3 subunit gamma/tau
MALLRVVHGATIPDPGELAKLLEQGGGLGASHALMAPASQSDSTVVNINAPDPQMPADFSGLLLLLAKRGFVNIEMTLRDVMRLVEYAPPLLAYQLAGPVAPGFVEELRDALLQVTGTRWEVERRDGEAQPSLLEIEQAKKAEQKRVVLESPMVKAALAAFPEAQLVENEDTDTQRKASA